MARHAKESKAREQEAECRSKLIHLQKRYQTNGLCESYREPDGVLPQADVHGCHKRALPGWLRWLMRVLIWIPVAIAVGVGLLVNYVLCAAPRAYEGIHDTQRWVPMAYLTPEARDYAEWLWGGPPSVRAVLYPRIEISDHAAYICVLWTLDEEVALELALNYSTTFERPPRSVDLELLFQHSFSDREKEHYLNRLLEESRIDLFTYKRLMKRARKGPTIHYPGRPLRY